MRNLRLARFERHVIEPGLARGVQPGGHKTEQGGAGQVEPICSSRHLIRINEAGALRKSEPLLSTFLPRRAEIFFRLTIRMGNNGTLVSTDLALKKGQA